VKGEWRGPEGWSAANFFATKIAPGRPRGPEKLGQAPGGVVGGQGEAPGRRTAVVDFASVEEGRRPLDGDH
jgi:hypothetical protein